MSKPTRSITELNARFVGHGGDGVLDKNHNPVPFTPGVGVMMDCPCGCESMMYVGFENPIGGSLPPSLASSPEAKWKRTGDTIETLTLSPSIRRVGGCKWHGFIKNGQATRA